jgi:hypothetical protein
VNASSHTLDVRFDAKGLVAHAGLILPATLAQRLGLPELLRQHVRLQMASPTTPLLRAIPPFYTRPVAVCIAVTETH